MNVEKSAKRALYVIFATLLILSVSAQAQTPDNFDLMIVLPETTGVQAIQNGWDGAVRAEVIDTTLQVAGYYHFFPKVLYNSGNEQTNESFYLLAYSADGDSIYPEDANAGKFKVVEDDSLPNRHTNVRDAGIFLLPLGRNRLQLNHYDLIDHIYPQFLNGPMTGTQSVKFPDMIGVFIDTVIDGTIEIEADAPRTEEINGEVREVLYLNETVVYRFTVRNIFGNVVTGATLTNFFPPSLEPYEFSLAPIHHDADSTVWELPDIEYLNSYDITVKARLKEAVPNTYIPLADSAVLRAPKDYVLENNVANNIIYSYSETKLENIVKSDLFLDSNGDNLLTPGDRIDYTITFINNGDAVAGAVTFTDSIPQNTEYVPGSATTSRGTITATSPVLVIQIGDMAPGDDVTIGFQVELTAAVDSVSNQGYVEEAGLTPVPTDDPKTIEEKDPTITKANPAFNGSADVTLKDRLQDVNDDGALSNGDIISYTVKIENSGGEDATNVTYLNPIPENTAYVAGSVTTSKGTIFSVSPSLQINIGSIAGRNRETVTVTYNVRVTADVDSIVNQGEVTNDETSAEPTDDPDTPADNDPTVTTDPPRFSVSDDIIKSDSIQDVDGNFRISQGDIITYEIQLKNSGQGVAHQVVFEDTIPQYTELFGSVDVSKGLVINTSPVIQIEIGDMNPQETVTIQFSVIVTAVIAERVMIRLEAEADSIVNQGTLRCLEIDPEPTDDPDTPEDDDPTVSRLFLPPNFSGQGDVFLTDIFENTNRDDKISIGETISYEVTIQNSGEETANNVVYTNPVPENTAYRAGSLVTSKGTIVSTSPGLQVDIGTLAPNESEVVTISYVVEAIADVDSVVNQGLLTSAETPDEPTDDPETPAGDDPTITRVLSNPVFENVDLSDFWEDRDNNGVITVGDRINYTATLVNSGELPATNVRYNNPIPENTRLVRGSPQTSKGKVWGQDPSLFIYIGDVAPNESETITINYIVSVIADVDSVLSQGVVTSKETFPENSNDPATPMDNDPTITKVLGPPRFNVSSDVTLIDDFEDLDGDSLISAGDVINYSILIRNSGDSTAHNVVLTNPMPMNTSYVTNSAVTSKGIIRNTSPELVVEIGDIAPYRFETIAISYQVVVNADVDTVANQGVLTSLETLPEPTNDPDTPADNDPTLTIRLGPPSFDALDDVTLRDDMTDVDKDEALSIGDRIRYTIDIKNSGDNTATNVVLIDSIPEFTSYIANSVTTSKGSIVSTSPVLQVDIGTVAPRNSEIVTITYDVDV
ncbi:MAG: hypothetical protein V2J62_09370, partial [candidate division KSB1 bacterium]|nr:hypothetical protein [candidate division KSB1 bacterium]